MKSGFISDNPAELRGYIKHLFDNPEAAKEIGDAGRADAIRHFGKDMIKESWRSYLGE